MEIYIFKDQVIFYGKVKDLLPQLKKYKNKYVTVEELIKALLP